MTKRLTDRTAVVTGAANGIGRAVTRRLFEDGARVGALDIEREPLEQLVAELGSESVLALHADVTDEEALTDAFASAARAFDGIDVVVANAGIEPIADDNYLHELDASVLRRVVEVNLIGIVCTASPTGLYGGAPEEAAYSIAKGAVTALVRVIASGYAERGIRANAVVPGFTDTRANKVVFDDPEFLKQVLETIPLKRAGTPEEVASVIAFLASDEAAYVTGAVWSADGGATAV
jgi:NAD(P)-dependent dehydrogenase (short-subunit alcohol dehydrogenase family)